MSHEQILPLESFTITLMAKRSKQYSFPCSGIMKNSEIVLAALPIHQHRSMLKLSFDFLLNLTSRLTSIVFTKVTIGIGEDIHSSNASARLVSCGLTSFFISSSYKPYCVCYVLVILFCTVWSQQCLFYPIYAIVEVNVIFFNERAIHGQVPVLCGESSGIGGDAG